MKSKAKSRKRKHLRKLFKGAMNYITECVEIRTLIQKEREKYYPKLATGGLVFGEWQRKEIETPETGFIRRIEMNIDVKQMIANLGKQNK